MNKVIFWDFQDTLAHNDWMLSKALYKALLKSEPNTNLTIDEFKKLKISGMPWQEPDKDYSHLTAKGEWWKLVESLFKEAYKELNIDEEKATEFAKQAHIELTNPDEFKLYEDTIEVLNYFKMKGWRNIILSNHIPELPYIVESLGLNEYISDCISSANVGFEKPNIKIYEYALSKAEYPEKVWMVGDSITSDVKSPERLGINGVLVRSKRLDDVKHYSKDLIGLKDIIGEK